MSIQFSTVHIKKTEKKERRRNPDEYTYLHYYEKDTPRKYILIRCNNIFVRIDVGLIKWADP